jgi:hypothetical protein
VLQLSSMVDCLPAKYSSSHVRTELMLQCHQIAAFHACTSDSWQTVSPLRDMARKLHGLFDGLLLPLDIVVLSRREWEHSLRLPGHNARTAQREGVRVHG